MKEDIEKLVNKFSEMQGSAALSIETLTILISTFAKSRDLFQGEQIHCLTNKTDFCDECRWLLRWIFTPSVGK